ncbi:MAG: sigma-70 family RNA polymerase sigma factor [Acidimicrobiia bacterium]|nr:sigma-70 family RNA polymerase sigma factor [Acidimicrobiia bacterium]
MGAVEEFSESFTIFVKEVEPRLRHALVASLGQEEGREATAEALAYAWEHWGRLEAMENAAGYLYRVGRSRGRPRRSRPVFDPVPSRHLPEVEPGLPDALSGLSEKQRVAVVMVHAYEWSRGEAAEVLGVSVSTLDTHLQRGLAKLRDGLGVQSHA